ncbi:MAG TPA: hypothetical protein VEQ63_03380 [Bryobacteraceae bacterium]|nr:hypothetical protein [Bryobacteraceae bacterium]
MRLLTPAALLIGLVGLVQLPVMQAAIVTVPPDLKPGDTYRLIFVTSATRNATSTDISDYNSFVSSLAGSVPELVALGASWSAIASTSMVDASANVGPSAAPIYRLDGQFIAAHPDDFWDGTLSASILLTETGAESSATAVWTGTLPTGDRHPAFALGADLAVTGVQTTRFRRWIFDELASTSSSHALYGISSELTVPAAPIPEPSSLWLAMGALLFLSASRKFSGTIH